MKVKAECSACGGTGLYQGFAEFKNEAVICLQCDGTGAETITYKPFVARRRHANKKIEWVSFAHGKFIPMGVGPRPDRVSVDDFYAGKLPKARTR